MVTIQEYLDTDGKSPFARWFNTLSAQAALKVTTYVTHIEHGNFSRVESVGSGMYECRIDWGPGYRVYFGRDGDTLVILLSGGTKKRQQKDIEAAKALWQDYKQRKQAEYNMAITRDFRDTIQARASRDPAFREGLLTESIASMLSGDIKTGKSLLRDYINATLGFEALGLLTDKSPKSLMRMLSPAGNPTANNLFGIIHTLQQREGVQFHVEAVR